MAKVPTGTTFAVATAFSAAKTVSSISNATEAVVSCTAHGFSNGDIVVLSTGWGRLHKRAFRVKSVTTDSFNLENANTTNTDYYPVGSSAGTVRKISTFQQINKIMNPQSSGGDPKQVNYKFVESDVENSINDGFSAVQESFEIDADEIGTASYSALQTLTDSGDDTVLRKTLKGGSIILTPCTIALNENVRMQDGQINRCVVSVSGTNRPTRY